MGGLYGSSRAVGLEYKGGRNSGADLVDTATVYRYTHREPVMAGGLCACAENIPGRLYATTSSTRVGLGSQMRVG